MVWIHGGAYERGDIFGNPPRFDGRWIATMGDVIVVAIAYRVGPLGFMSIPGKIPANLGLHDQLLGLKWVNENIDSFGGDPGRVTIFGESAGSMSVGALVLSPLAKGFFTRAIAESGAPSVEAITESVARSVEKTKAYASKLNCSHGFGKPFDADEAFKCIRAKSVEDLQLAALGDLSRNEHFIPVYGDEVLPIRPAVALRNGNFNRVDYLYGKLDFLFVYLS